MRCKTCGGTGKTLYESNPRYRDDFCDACNGTGEIISKSVSKRLAVQRPDEVREAYCTDCDCFVESDHRCQQWGTTYLIPKGVLDKIDHYKALIDHQVKEHDEMRKQLIEYKDEFNRVDSEKDDLLSDEKMRVEEYKFMNAHNREVYQKHIEELKKECGRDQRNAAHSQAESIQHLDRIKELVRQIEQMKCCGNCGVESSDSECNLDYLIKTDRKFYCDNWKMKELISNENTNSMD